MIGDATFPVSITGLGAYAPDRVLTNADLETLVDTSNDWIIERTGIRERRIAADDAGPHRSRAAGLRDRACAGGPHR